MKKSFITFLIFISCFLWASVFAQETQQAPQTQLPQVTPQFFDGAWLPQFDPSLIGIKNFRTLTNLRPIGPTIEGVMGYSKITDTAASGYVVLSNGYHYKKDIPPESHVLAYGESSGNTESGLYIFDVDIPGTGEFGSPSGLTLYQNLSGADITRCSPAPANHVACADGKETYIWGGDEVLGVVFITSTQSVTNYPTNPKDYTVQVQNTLDDAENVALIGGGNDEFTKTLLHFNGIDGSQVFTESATGTTETRTWTVDTTAVLDIDQKKFGTAAGYFDGGTSIYAADSVDWHLDNGDGGVTDFTIEFWVRFESIPINDVGFFQQYISGDTKVQLFFKTPENTIRFDQTNNGVALGSIESSTLNVSLNEWYHVSLVGRKWGTGIQTAITFNGEAVATANFSGNWVDVASNLEIGVIADSSGVSRYLNGWIDEFRVTKGTARWTSNFNPPTRAYATESNTFLIGSTRPFSGVSVTVKDGNTLSGQANAYTIWNGSSWSSVTSGGTEFTAGFARSGISPWGNTVGIMKPKYLEGRLLYWAQGELSGGEASISHVTLTIPFQKSIDIWDGVFRKPIGFHSSRSNELTDFTDAVNTSSSELFPIGAEIGGLTTGDNFIIIFEDRMQAIDFTLLSGNTQPLPSGVTPFYWSGVTWAQPSAIYDATADVTGVTPLGSSGVVTWQPPEPEEEFTQTLFNKSGYAYKFEWVGTLGGSGADNDFVIIDVVKGIPAPLSLKPFKWTALFKNRLMKCNFSEGGQGNRCDFSLSNAPDVWNGRETSDNGRNSIFFGNGAELLAGTQLYNRYGNNLIEMFVTITRNSTHALIVDPVDATLNDIQTISDDVGIAAPLSLVTTAVGFEVVAGELKRQVALWLDYSGPVSFDGAFIDPLEGLENFFDPNHDDYLGKTDIETARGGYDRTYKEYNLKVGSKWFVYVLPLKKWFDKSTGSQPIPQSFISVTDTAGTSYVYSSTNNGLLVRLENGQTWDGVAIDQTAHTGDFRLNNDAFRDTRILDILVENIVLSSAETLTITHYDDTNTSGTIIDSIPLASGAFRTEVVKRNVNRVGRRHSVKFFASTSGVTKGWRPIEWALRWKDEGEDSRLLN